MGTNRTRFVVLAMAVAAMACYIREEPPPAAPPPPPIAQNVEPPAPSPAPPAPSPAPPQVLAPPPHHGIHGHHPPQPSPAAVSLGCFRDQGDPNGTNGRDLNGFVVNEPSMTTEACTETCATKGFPYAATQYSTWCFCGASYGRSGPADNCNMKCAGNQAETCGGTWANSVYQLGAAPPPAPTPPAPSSAAVSLGCFRDQGDPNGTNGRDLNGLAVNNPSMTTEACNQTCVSKGFPYAATQYSTWCFCGASYGRSGRADNCNMKCAGNQGETCGGTWANSVYQVK